MMDQVFRQQDLDALVDRLEPRAGVVSVDNGSPGQGIYD
jgi:hypothetical protein